MHLKIVILKKKDEDDENYKIINCLDDVLQLIKNHGKVEKGDEPKYNLAFRDDKLNGFFNFHWKTKDTNLIYLTHDVN